MAKLFGQCCHRLRTRLLLRTKDFGIVFLTPVGLLIQNSSHFFTQVNQASLRQPSDIQLHLSDRFLGLWNRALVQLLLNFLDRVCEICFSRL